MECFFLLLLFVLLQFHFVLFDNYFCCDSTALHWTWNVWTNERSKSKLLFIFQLICTWNGNTHKTGSNIILLEIRQMVYKSNANMEMILSLMCFEELHQWFVQCRRWCLCWLNSIKNIKTIHTFNRFRDVIKMQLAIGNRPLCMDSFTNAETFRKKNLLKKETHRIYLLTTDADVHYNLAGQNWWASGVPKITSTFNPF